MENRAQMLKLLISICSQIMPSYADDFWQPDTELFGAIPEFDSMSIVMLIGEIEEQFDIELDDDDITAENFATITSILSLIDSGS